MGDGDQEALLHDYRRDSKIYQSSILAKHYRRAPRESWPKYVTFGSPDIYNRRLFLTACRCRTDDKIFTLLRFFDYFHAAPRLHTAILPTLVHSSKGDYATDITTRFGTTSRHATNVAQRHTNIRRKVILNITSCNRHQSRTARIIAYFSLFHIHAFRAFFALIISFATYYARAFFLHSSFIVYHYMPVFTAFLSSSSARSAFRVLAIDISKRTGMNAAIPEFLVLAAH